VAARGSLRQTRSKTACRSASISTCQHCPPPDARGAALGHGSCAVRASRCRFAMARSRRSSSRRLIKFEDEETTVADLLKGLDGIHFRPISIEFSDVLAFPLSGGLISREVFPEEEPRMEADRPAGRRGGTAARRGTIVEAPGLLALPGRGQEIRMIRTSGAWSAH
jgi:hypothetical protein